MRVGIFCAVGVDVFVRVLVFVVMFLVRMVVIVREMNVELHAFNLRFVFSRAVQVIAVEMQLCQFVLELMEINAEVEQRTDEHVAADAAENIEVKSFH